MAGFFQFPVVASVTPGTPKKLVAAADANVARAQFCHEFVVSALPAITNLVYLVNGSAAANTSTLANVVHVFTAGGEAFSLTSNALNDLDITGLYVDAVNNAATDGLSAQVTVL